MIWFNSFCSSFGWEANITQEDFIYLWKNSYSQRWISFADILGLWCLNWLWFTILQCFVFCSYFCYYWFSIIVVVLIDSRNITSSPTVLCCTYMSLVFWYLILIRSTPVKCLSTYFQFLPAWLDAMFSSGLENKTLSTDTKCPTPSPNSPPNYSPIWASSTDTTHPNLQLPGSQKPVADVLFVCFCLIWFIWLGNVFVVDFL